MTPCLMPNTAKPTLCFLLSTAVTDDVFMGGAMVTDIYGLPIEFRYTEPVVATKLQRILYGDVLERYIQTDVILSHLLENLDNKPSLFLTSEPSFLSVIAAGGRQVAWLGETRNPSLSDFGAQQEVTDDEVLVQLSTTGPPARVRFPESGDPSATSKQQEIVKVLAEAAKTMDVHEPMRRVEKAVKLLWEQSTDSAARDATGK